MSRARLALLAVLLLVAAPYLSGLDNGFVWLDHSEIEDGTLVVRSWSEVPGLFLEDRTTAGYHRPFYALLHSANLALFGLEPRAFLATSLALHLANCALAFALVRRHGGGEGRAAAVALLFGLHPVNTAVAGLTHSTMDALYVTGVLGAWLCFARAESGGGSSRRRAVGWSLSLVALLVALWSKENAFLYPVAVAAACVLPWSFAGGERPAAARLRAYAVVVGAASALVLLGRLGEGSVRAAAVPGAALGLGERLLTFAGVYVGYWKKLVVPLDLSVCDTVTRFSALDGGAQLHRVASAAILVAAQVFAVRRLPRLLPWLALANLSLLPVAQVVPILHFRADRFLYLATLGVAGALVEGGSALLARAPRLVPGLAPAVLALLVAGGYAVRVLPRLAQFRTDETLFAPEVARTPDYREGLSQLGRFHDRRGRHELAGELYAAALAPYPGRLSYVDRDGVALALSQNLLARGEVEEAYALTERELRAEHPGKGALRPRVREELEYNRAVAAHRLGRNAEALAVFRRYAVAHPEDASCQYLLGKTAMALGEDGAAREALRRYLALAPAAPDRGRVEGWLAELDARGGGEAR